MTSGMWIPILGDARQMQSDLHKLMDENKQIRDTITDLKCRSMKNNLIFTGLGEHPDENTEEKLRDFIYHELRIHFHIPFGNVHRFGRSTGGRPRPIVAGFLYHETFWMWRTVLAGWRGHSSGLVSSSQLRSRSGENHFIQSRSSWDRRVTVLSWSVTRLFVNGRPYDEDTIQPVTNNERNTDERNDETSLKSRYMGQQQQRPRSPPRQRDDRPAWCTDDQPRREDRPAWRSDNQPHPWNRRRPDYIS